jgi:DNA-binding LacI/PurR family transcriptional regulator
VGQTAADLLLRRIKGDRSYFEQITVPAELVIRSSCQRLPRNVTEITAS